MRRAMRPRKLQAAREIRVSLGPPASWRPVDALGIETQVNLACCAAGIATLATGTRGVVRAIRQPRRSLCFISMSVR
jgi:hypothetical protein